MKNTKNFPLRILINFFEFAVWNSALFLNFLSGPVFAFNLDFSSDRESYNFRAPVYDDGIYRVWVERHRMQKLPFGGTRRFNHILTNHASGNYLFRKSSRSLEGGFEVHHYYPCNVGQPCGVELNLNPRTDGVGASLDLSYVPIAPDPDLPILPSTLHWIQMYRSIGSVVQPVGVIDRTNHPLYYTSLTSSNPSFTDTPYRVPHTIPQRWIAELYLAEVVGQNPQGQTIVEIWDGVRWGFHSRVLRKKPGSEPQPFPFPLPLPFPELDPRRIPVQCTGGSGGGGCDQYNPLPGMAESNWLFNGNSYWLFNSVHSGLWFGIENQLANSQPRRYGFEFKALGDMLFESILGLPIDVDDDDLFTVSVDDVVLGDFDASETIDFVSLLGSGVSNFKITGIDPLFGTTVVQFPIQLSFINDTGSFGSRLLDCSLGSGYSGGGGFSSGYSGGGGVGCEPYSVASGVGLLSDSSFARTRPVPEPSSIFGVIVFSILSGLGIISFRQRQP